MDVKHPPAERARDPQGGEGTRTTEEEMLQRVRDGDEAAATALFERYFPLLRSQVRRSLPAVLRKKLGESDVIQEAYVAVLQRLHDFEPRGEGSFEAWLRQIVDHKATDQIRRYLGTAKRDSSRERSQLDGVGGAGELGRGETPSQLVAEAEASRSLLEAIERLSPDHQTVLHLVHFKGLSLADAAVILDRSPDAVRMLYGRAVAQLQKQMEGA